MKIDFLELKNEADIQRWNLDEFASSFDHSVTRLFPIWIGFINGKLATYCHLHTHVAAYPAVHPSISPREMYHLGWTWLCKLKSEYGDPLIMMPVENRRNLYSKIGLVPIEKEVYLIRE